MYLLTTTKISAPAHFEPVITSNIKLKAQALRDAAKQSGEKLKLAVTCPRAAYELRLPLYSEGTLVSVDSTSFLETCAARGEHLDLVEDARARAAASVVPTDFSGFRLVELPKGSTFSDVLADIEAAPEAIKILIGPTGSHKTTVIDALCQATHKAGERFYHYSPSRMIAQAQVARFEAQGIQLAHYQKLGAADLIHKRSGVSTTHSMHTPRIIDGAKGCALEVIDEAATAIRHMATFKELKARIEAVEALRAKIATAQNLVLADADFTDAALDVVRQANNPGGAVVFYIPRDYSGININLHGDKAEVLARFTAALEAGNRALAIADHAKNAAALDLLAQSKGYRGLLITAKTAEQDAQQAFIADPNAALAKENYDYVIYSPAYFRFGSIQTEYFQSHFALACGVVTPCDFIQGLRRDRTAKHWEVAFSLAPRRGYWQASWDATCPDKLISAISASEQFLSEETKITLPAAWAALGFQVSLPAATLSKRKARQANSALFQAKQAIKEDLRSGVMEAKAIPLDKAKKLTGERQLSEKEEREVHRAFCKHWLGSVDAEAVAWYAEGAAKARLLNLDALGASAQRLATEDAREAGLATVQKGHWQARQRDLGPLLAAMTNPGGFDYGSVKYALAAIYRSKTWDYYGLPHRPITKTAKTGMGLALAVARDLGYTVRRTASGKRYVIDNLEQVATYHAAWRESGEGLT